MPQQLTTLKEIVFRSAFNEAPADSKVQEKMQFSRQQKESLDRIRWEWDEMGRRNGQESNAKAFALLTPHEQEVLLQERERRESGRSSGKKPMPQPRPKRKQRRRRDNSRTSPLARQRRPPKNATERLAPNLFQGLTTRTEACTPCLTKFSPWTVMGF